MRGTHLGIPIPFSGMGEDVVEVISHPRYVAASALALDTYEEELPGAISSRRLWKTKRVGNAETGGVGWQAGLGLPQM